MPAQGRLPHRFKAAPQGCTAPLGIRRFQFNCSQSIYISSSDYYRRPWPAVQAQAAPELDPMAALEQQLRQVSLRVPLTPPATPSQQDSPVGIVYDACMELHQGPPRALPAPLLPATHLCVCIRLFLPRSIPGQDRHVVGERQTPVHVRMSAPEAQVHIRVHICAHVSVLLADKSSRADLQEKLPQLTPCRARRAACAHGAPFQAHQRGGPGRTLLPPGGPDGARRPH